MWPADHDTLIDFQHRLAAETPTLLDPASVRVIAGCFVCFGRGGAGPGAAGDEGWGAAAALEDGRIVSRSVVTGRAGAAYRPGLLAAREGPLLAAAVAQLDPAPDLLLVNATGRDHPRRAGLALHLGAALDIASIGITDRTLVADGREPARAVGATAPLLIDAEVVGCRLRTRAGANPVAVHIGWRTDIAVASALIHTICGGHRTPEPLREARRLARTARAEAAA
jgi:deoxyribonuclease V